MAIGRAPDAASSDVDVLPLAGLAFATSYRVRTTSGLKDIFGRSLDDPKVLELPETPPVIAPGDIGASSFEYERRFPIVYDSAIAAGDDANGLFPGGQPMGFQGQYTDPVLGFLLTPNRVYDARKGSWLSQDPLGDRDSANLYGFVGARPHEKTDPLGLAAAGGDTIDPDYADAARPFVEARARESQAMRTVGRLAGGISTGLDIATDFGPGIGLVKIPIAFFEAYEKGGRGAVTRMGATVGVVSAVAILSSRLSRLKNLGAKAMNEVDEVVLASERTAAARLTADSEARAEGTVNKILRDSGQPEIGRAVNRYLPGSAYGGEGLPTITSGWLRGSEGNAGLVPRKVADCLRGRQFRDFDEFRATFWQTVGEDSELASGFSKSNVTRMKSGKAPIAAASQWSGEKGSYILHHRTPIGREGGVYDLDNILIVTPRYHDEVLAPSYHFAGGR